MFRKKNLVILAMLVVVCAAVIMNYQFQNADNRLAATSALENGEKDKEKILGEALLVNGKKEEPQPKDGKEGEKKEEKKPEEKDKKEAEKTSMPVKGDYFSEARVDRKQTRDEATELLKTLVADKNNTEEVRKKATEDVSAIAAATQKESAIETLIKGKGFTECLVVISDKACNVMVKTGGLSAPQVAQIKEIVIAQTAMAGSTIKIIEIK